MGSFNEPLGEFLIAEKRELELEKQFDSTFHSNREGEDTVTQRSRTRQDGEPTKDRKANFDEVAVHFCLSISKIYKVSKHKIQNTEYKMIQIYSYQVFQIKPIYYANREIKG